MTSYISGEEGGFNVEIQFEGTWTPELQQAFVDAAEYISDVILADIPDVGGDYNVDDIRIEARLTDIDGAGGVLGQAGPTVVRGGDAPLPVTGIMEFDIADADYYNDNGLWDDIILHEMLHTLGLGTMWSYVGLTSGSVEGGDLRFTGANATAAYNSEFADIAANDAGSASGVPVETHGGSGTAGGHWDEELFGNELATGYVNGSNYVSSMTLASLEDLGYDTVIDDVTRDGDMTGPIPADPLNTAPTNVA